MAINVLLDNCVLMKLFSGTEFSGYLKQIISWHKSGEIRLYCPEALMREWEVHRKDKLKSIENIIKQHELDVKRRVLLGLPIDIGDAQLSAADKLLRSQVDAIDLLMAEAVQIKDHLAGSMMISHKNAGKAPFRVNPKSDNDALILFATCEYLISMGETELYFLSSNHKDYSMEGQLNKLHPDITSSYAGIKFCYFHDLAEGIGALIELGLSSTKSKMQAENAVPVYIQIDRTLSVSGQIYQYLHHRFDDITILPKGLFITHFPFITSEKARRDAPPFTLQTDNKEVFDLFIELADKVKSGALDWSAMEFEEFNEERRQAEIIHKLRSCFVHYISYNHKTVEIPVLPANQCECLNCRFKRSELNEDFFTGLINIPDKKHPGLKAAYLQYLIGNIIEAVSILKQVVVDAEKSFKCLTYYIANYNLALIGKMYRFSSPEERDLSWVKELQEIDMDTIFIGSGSPSTDDILIHIKDAEFLSQATDRLKELSGKIKDNYVDQNRGWNDDVRLLLDQYFQTIAFVEQNCIMLDYFSDLDILTAYFLDGVFASYASHHELGGRLLHFTDAIVQHIVSYSKSSDIIKYRARYKIQIADFLYTGDQSNLVKELLTLLNSYQAVTAQFDQADNPGQRFFWKRFKTKFHNSLTLCALLKITREDVNLICEALLLFISSENLFNEYELLKTLSYFIRNNCSLIDKQHLEAFLLFSYTAKLEQRDILIHTISNLSRIEDLELKLPLSQWTKLQARYLVNTEIQDNSIVVSEICCLFDFLKEKKYKEDIAKFMTDFLKHKFNSDVYYTATIHKLIKPTSRLNAFYDKKMLQRATEGRRPRIFETSFYQSDTLDQYINFMFCFNRPFDARFIEAAGSLDNYYRWILDIDGYDYQDFHPDWLFNHLTSYYRERFKKSQILREWVRKSALKSKDLRVGNFFIQMYTESSNKIE